MVCQWWIVNGISMVDGEWYVNGGYSKWYFNSGYSEWHFNGGYSEWYLNDGCMVHVFQWWIANGM